MLKLRQKTIIRDLVQKGYSANAIQRTLMAMGIGARRQNILRYVKYLRTAKPPPPKPEILPKRCTLIPIPTFYRQTFYRTTFGTNFSDRNKPISCTGYFFSKQPFDYAQTNHCLKLFITRILRLLYPKKRYTYSDFWGDEKAIREEINTEITSTKDLDHTYIIQIRRNGRLAMEEEGTW